MPRKASTEPKTRTIRVPQKNGDIYVYERITKYNPEKHYNEVIKSRLIGKIPYGQNEMVPTRPKKRPVAAVSAKSFRIGATDILEWIGTESGIDQDLLCSTDKATALKILSIARYWTANPGRTIPYFEEWQINHRIPYPEGMSANACYDLMHEIGTDADLAQKFFRARAERVPSRPSVAFDSTTVSSYSGNQIEARYGYNKAGDGLKTVKLLTQYCVETGQPVAYYRQPGDIPDVVSVANACDQLSMLGMERPMLVMDRGFYSEANICILVRRHIKFLMRGEIDTKWIRPELDQQMGSIQQLANACPFEPDTYGVTVTVKHTFQWHRERARGESARGGAVREEHRIYLHFFLNTAKAGCDSAELADSIRRTAERLKDGISLSASEERIADKYLTLRNTRGGLSISYNDPAFREALRYSGWFVLVSNSPMEAPDALRRFRQREKVEEFYRADKQHVDGDRTRMWYPNGLNGRFFCQFVVLCYHEYLHRAVSNLKRTLAVPNGDPAHDTKKNLDAEKRLLDWLNHMSIERLFAWFDCIEETAVDNSMGRRRWQTETTARDRLFLSKLGITK